MIGDKLIIKDEHIKAGERVMDLVLPLIRNFSEKYIITIAGESGAGKSEVAAVLSDKLLQKGIKSAILQQDDYFVYPPYTNDRMRRKDIKHVGPKTEVRLDLLDQNLQDFSDGKKEIEKPLVIYKEDRITSEKIKMAGIDVVIVEGTYTTILKNVHTRVFIDRTYLDTRAARVERAREDQDDFLEKVLKIEHEIISSHKSKADIVLTKNYDVEANDGR
jgi:uridine kinase